MSNTSSGLFKVLVSFTNLEGNPLTGSSWRVKVRDQDPLFDGTLGEARLDENGGAGILISVADISSLDSPGERTPDLYFVLYHQGKKFFTSGVTENVDFEQINPATQRATANTTQSFGPYKVDTTSISE